MEFSQEIDEQHIKREKAAARDLRKSRWWQNRIQSTQCYYCSKKLQTSDVTMDHIVPISRGGKSTRGNVITACKDCNNRKKNMTIPEWSEYLETL